MYNRRRAQEEIIEEKTDIWKCTSEDCNGWMRDNFSFEKEPDCKICGSPMKLESKVLPQLINPNTDIKSTKKGTEI